jgi:hypothetical protein
VKLIEIPTFSGALYGLLENGGFLAWNLWEVGGDKWPLRQQEGSDQYLLLFYRELGEAFHEMDRCCFPNQAT